MGVNGVNGRAGRYETYPYRAGKCETCPYRAGRYETYPYRPKEFV